MANEVDRTTIFRAFRPTDAEAFRLLNEEWIELYFRLEDKDRRMLGDPQGEIVAKGGHIFVAEMDGTVLGCVALLAYPGAEYELSKMAVTPGMRGCGVGRQLLRYALAQAAAAGASRVFLGSNSVLGNAVRLYESLGFVHVPTTALPHLGYVRADVYMAHNLGGVADA